MTLSEAADALRQAHILMSDVEGPPESEDEQRRLTSTLHALDHALGASAPPSPTFLD